MSDTGYYIGIDPGLDGAIGVLDENGYLMVHDTPTVTMHGTRNGKRITRREYDNVQMADLLGRWRLKPAAVIIESVHAMPRVKGKDAGARMGVVSAFRMGYGVGIWHGILAALGIPYQAVQPSVWKRKMMVPADKGVTRLVASRFWPRAELHLVRHDGRAEALLMAEYGRRFVWRPDWVRDPEGLKTQSQPESQCS